MKTFIFKVQNDELVYIAFQVANTIEEAIKQEMVLVDFSETIEEISDSDYENFIVENGINDYTYTTQILDLTKLRVDEMIDFDNNNKN